MKLISEYFRQLIASTEEHRFEAIVNVLAIVVFGIAAIVTFLIAIEGLSQGLPFVASMGLLIISLVLIMLVISIPSVTSKWLR
jgi:hypothetical protein